MQDFYMSFVKVYALNTHVILHYIPCLVIFVQVFVVRLTHLTMVSLKELSTRLNENKMERVGTN